MSESPFGNVLTPQFSEWEDATAEPARAPLRELAEASLQRINETLSASEVMNVRKDPALQTRVQEIIRLTVSEVNSARVTRGDLPVVDEANSLDVWVERIFDILYGLGPLETLLEDEAVEDVAVNGPDEVYVRTAHGWQNVPVDLAADPDQLQWRVNQVIAFSGKQAGPLMPIVDVQLPTSHRLNVVTAPLTETWPVVVIRRHRPVAWTLEEFVGEPVELKEDLIQHEIPDYSEMEVEGALVSGPAATYLHLAVLAGLNILIIGRTGVGKTTFLSALGQLIPHDRRVVVVEDTRELNLRPNGDRPRNCVYFVTRQKLLEGGIDVDMQGLIVTALRQRPDHLVVGEARGAEIYDLLNAMQTGHGGNLTSIHANSLSDLAQRVNAMLYQAGAEMDAERSARLVGSSFHVGLTLLQDFDGRRYVAEIGEFTGEVEGGLPVVRTLFEGGEAHGFRPTLVADRSAHEEHFRRVGLSFERVVESAR